MSKYKQSFLPYLKAGYSVIPDNVKKKSPLVKNWTEYSSRQPTKEEVDEWCTYPETNIAIMLGEQGDIIALDFDETNPELIAMIEPLIPPSPVERKGKKGFVRFYQYSGESNQEIFRVVVGKDGKKKKKPILELLSNKKKVTIPPSIHPETNKPYIWTDKALLDIDPTTLPKFPPMFFAHIQSKLQMLETRVHDQSEPSKSEGRNLTLSTYIGKLIKKPHTILGTVQELIKFDENNHDTALFSDTTEYDSGNKEYNALMFYFNHLRSINNKHITKDESLELPILSTELEVIDKLVKSKENKTQLPIPTGLLKEIYDHILKNSFIEQPAFALSTSLILLGTIISRKFIFQNTTSNLYILNIAESGSGKDSCQQVVKELLYNIKAGDKLLGATSYPSEASIIKDLDLFPVRLDIIDECSTFLSAASYNKGVNTYASGIGDTLCELYSCSNGYYLGKSLASSSSKIGAVYRPHVNLLCSTTFRGIHESISITSLEKGLFARFLVFFGDSNASSKRITNASKPTTNLIKTLKFWYDYQPPKKNIGNFSKYNRPPVRIPVTENANALLTEYHNTFDKMRKQSKSDGYKRPIISRLYQHMLKIAMISGVSNTAIGKQIKVRPQDVEFAYQLVNFYFDHITDFVKDNLYESIRGMKLNKVLNVIKNAGDDGITNAELAQKSTFISTNERVDIITDLKEANRVTIEPLEDGQFKFYYLG